MKRSKIVKITVPVVSFIALLFFSFVLAKAVKKPWDDTARQKAPANFIKLSQGQVHYQLAGNKDASLVVLLHGFSIPMYIWDSNFDFLVDQGYLVLRYDHFGRGFSDKIVGPYDLDFFTDQLSSVLQALKLDQSFYLVGLSLGGGIAASYTVKEPERIKALCLIAPAGLPQKESLASRFYLAPLIGEYLFAVFGDGILKSRNEKNLYRPQDFAVFQSRFARQLHYSGFKESLLSTLRHFPMNSMGSVYSELGQLDLPVLLVWGKKDAVMDYSLHQDFLDYVKRVDFVSVDECGHNVNVEKAPEFNQTLLSFLKRQDSQSENRNQGFLNK